MATEFTLPELGEGVESAEVSRVLVHEGDTVDEGDNVLELATDKAIADLPCPHAGKVVKLHVSEGDTVEIGQPILSLEAAAPQETAEAQRGAPAEAEPAPEPSTPETPPAPPRAQAPRAETAAAEGETPEGETPEAKTPRTKTPRTKTAEAADRTETELTPNRRAEAAGGEPRSRTDGRPAAECGEETMPPPAGPATRRLARKLGIDLRELWSGQDRLRPEDVVEQYTARQSRAAAPPPLPDFSRFGPVERQPLGPIYKKAAENLTQSWQLVPHVTQNDLADITELEMARKRFVEQAPAELPKLTITPLVIKAVIAALQEFPGFNASLDAQRQELILKQYYHIGVAVDTEQGLLVPALRDADQKSIVQLAREMNELAERARARKLTMAEMEGATFTISNQGGIGGTSFTPIVSYPQVAILGLSRARWQAEVQAGNVTTRLMLPLSLSYDHRVINGADAARFVARLAQLLADPFTLLAVA